MLLTVYYTSYMAPEIPGLEAFMAAYSTDVPVVVGGGVRMKLGQALQFEGLSCTADKADRLDPRKRIGFLVGLLAAAGSLLPEHAFLLEPLE